MMPRCPGQDLRFWTPRDIFDVGCPHCGGTIEFWKDDPSRRCPGCGREARNPRLDVGCAEWCKYAAECLGQGVVSSAAVAPVIDRLELLLGGYCATDPQAGPRARRFLDLAQQVILVDRVDPCVLQTAALLVGALAERGAPGPEESTAIQAMLERAGIAAEVAHRIRDLVQAVRSSTALPGPEYRALAKLWSLEGLSPGA